MYVAERHNAEQTGDANPNSDQTLLKTQILSSRAKEIWYHEISYGHTVFHDSMKYRMAIWYFMES